MKVGCVEHRESVDGSQFGRDPISTERHALSLAEFKHHLSAYLLSFTKPYSGEEGLSQG